MYKRDSDVVVNTLTATVPSDMMTPTRGTPPRLKAGLPHRGHRNKKKKKRRRTSSNSAATSDFGASKKVGMMYSYRRPLQRVLASKLLGVRLMSTTLMSCRTCEDGRARVNNVFLGCPYPQQVKSGPLAAVRGRRQAFVVFSVLDRAMLARRVRSLGETGRCYGDRGIEGVGVRSEGTFLAPSY